MFLKNCNFRIIQATNFVSQLQRECSESVNNEPLDVMWVRDLPSVNAVNYDYLQFCVSVKSDPFTRLTFVPQPYAPSPLATRIYENAFLIRSEKPIHKKHYTKSLAISLPHDVDSRCPGENFTKLYFNTEIVLIFNVCSRRTEKKLMIKLYVASCLAGKQLRKQIFFGKGERKRRNRCGRVMEWKLSVQKFTAAKIYSKPFLLQRLEDELGTSCG